MSINRLKNTHNTDCQVWIQNDESQDCTCAPTPHNTASSPEDEQLEFAINELAGIIQHTHSFDDEPEKKARQLKRNAQAIKKAKATLEAWADRRADRRTAAVLERLYIKSLKRPANPGLGGVREALLSVIREELQALNPTKEEQQ